MKEDKDTVSADVIVKCMMKKRKMSYHIEENNSDLPSCEEVSNTKVLNKCRRSSCSENIITKKSNDGKQKTKRSLQEKILELKRYCKIQSMKNSLETPHTSNVDLIIKKEPGVVDIKQHIKSEFDAIQPCKETGLKFSPPIPKLSETEREISLLKDISKPIPCTAISCHTHFTFYSSKSFLKEQQRNKSLENKCPNCSKEFKHNNCFKIHTTKCNQLKKFKEPIIQFDLKEESINDEKISALFPVSATNTQGMKVKFFQCHHCSTMYNSKCSLVQHFSKNVCGNMTKRISCLYEDCNIKFTRYEHLLLHLPHYHNDVSYFSKVKYFKCFKSFQQWKEGIEDQTLSHLIKSRGSKKYKGSEYSYYECQFNAVCDGKRGPKRKTARRRKLGVVPHMFCPARMTIIRNMENGILCVNYIEKHSHELSEVRYHIPKFTMNDIIEKLRLNMSPQEILKTYQDGDNFAVDGPVDISDNVKFRNKFSNITLTTIRNLKYKLARQSQRAQRKRIGADNAEEEHYEVVFGDDYESYELIPVKSDSQDVVYEDIFIGGEGEDQIGGPTEIEDSEEFEIVVNMDEQSCDYVNCNSS